MVIIVVKVTFCSRSMPHPIRCYQHLEPKPLLFLTLIIVVRLSFCFMPHPNPFLFNVIYNQNYLYHVFSSVPSVHSLSIECGGCNETVLKVIPHPNPFLFTIIFNQNHLCYLFFSVPSVRFAPIGCGGWGDRVISASPARCSCTRNATSSPKSRAARLLQ